MCLNQILKNEQLALMQHPAADNPDDMLKHRRKLSLFAQILDDYPYPHRPYFLSNDRGSPSVPKLSGSQRLLPGVAVWENEGGLVKETSSQKHSNCESDKSKVEKSKVYGKLPSQST